MSSRQSLQQLQHGPAAEAIRALQWPRSCDFFDAECMNEPYLQDFLLLKTSYGNGSLESEAIQEITVTDGQLRHTRGTLQELRNEHQHTSLRPWKMQTRLFFVLHERVYDYERQASRCNVDVTAATWLNLLQHLQVLPHFVEVLHNNNGVVGSHVSYCGDDESHYDAQTCRSQNRPRAYHIYLKQGKSKFEHAVYARHDFHTGEDIILVAGTDFESYPRDLISRHQTGTHLTLFHVLQDLTSTWLHGVEERRWVLDFETQSIEAKTGIACIRSAKGYQLPVEQLNVDAEAHQTSNFLRNTGFISSRMQTIFEFLGAQLNVFDDLCAQHDREHRINDRSCSRLTCCLRKNLDIATTQQMQLSVLHARVESQIGIMQSLTTQRDVQSSIEIAQSTKKDSELMRGIAAVTMVFLPATFVATFFSMVFFHVGDEESIHLTVSGFVWMYPCVTLPLTLVIAGWYGIYSTSGANNAADSFNKILRKS